MLFLVNRIDFRKIAAYWVVSLGLAGGVFAQSSGDALLTPQDFGGNPKGEILWDEYGVPHIYGSTLLSVVRGYGYAQMENHAELILEKVAEARGRTAEYFGPGAQNANVQKDIQIRTYGIPGRALEWYQNGGKIQQLILRAFAAGVNAYAEKYSDSIDERFRQILPFQPEDALAVGQYTVHFNFMPIASGIAAELAAWQANPNARLIKAPAQTMAVGSNGWALGRSRSANGHPILMGNPHLPWGVNQPAPGLEVFQWMEANLVIGDPKHPRLNASGVTFPGLPFIGIGFNDYLGWTHTVNSIKNVDLYELTLTNGGYLYDASTRPFTSRADEIKIRQPDGSFVTQSFTVLSSVHGPVVAQKGGKALALRVAGLDAPSAVTEYWEMMFSRNLLEFTLANSQLQMPFFNLIYADRQGQTMYVFDGRQPVRPGGTYADWAGILAGDTSSTLWTKTLNWWQLPKAIDPPGGYVSNSNEPPWFATFPQVIRRQDYPSYIAPDTTFFRPQAASLFLTSQARFSLQDVLNAKESTHMLFAERVLPDLIAAARSSGNATANAAADVLAQWTGNSDATDTGAVLFELWYQAYMADASSPRSSSWGAQYPAFRIEWSDAAPLVTPVGLGDPARSVQYLVAAAGLLQAQFGRLDVKFGDVNRVVLADHDSTFQTPLPLTNLPASGSGDPFGGIRALYYFQAPVPKQNWVDVGDNYIQLVDFTPQGAEAQALLTYGNASRPGSSHIADQIGLFQQKELRPAYRTRSDVEAHAVKHEQY